MWTSPPRANTTLAIDEIVIPFADGMRTDTLGNLIAVRRGSSDFNLMLDAHRDEIGSGARRLLAASGVDVPCGWVTCDGNVVEGRPPGRCTSRR